MGDSEFPRYQANSEAPKTRPLPRSRKFLRLVLKGISFTIIAALTLEACARIDDWATWGAPLLGAYNSNLLVAFDQLGNRGRPNGRYLKWKLNSLGFRGPEIDFSRPRILCIGASETFGQQEKEGNEWPRQVERDLRRMPGGEALQLVNAGIAGETFPTSVLRMPERTAQIKPVAVLMYPSLANYLMVPFLKPYTGPPPAPPRFEIRMQSRIENVMKQVLPIRVQTALRKYQIAKTAPNYGPEIDNISPELQQEFAGDLEAAIRSVREAHSVPVLITHANRFKDHVSPEEEFMVISWRKFYPNLREDGFVKMEQTMNAVEKRVGASQGVLVIDAASAMPTGPAYFSDFVHFTDEGARLFSAFVSDHLQPCLQKDGFECPALPEESPEPSHR